jgi:hypothetical protein
MSYESNDERIERLEQKVAELLSIQKDVLKLSMSSQRNQQNLNLCLLKEAVAAKNSQVALVEIIAKSPVIQNNEARRIFLDAVALAVTRNDQIEASLVEFEKKHPLPPPDEPPAPGPA